MVDPIHTTAEVLDISFWQGEMDMSVTRKRAHALWVRATYGLSPDTKYFINRSKARVAGIPCGAYHYFKPGVDGRQQAKAFLETIGRVTLEGTYELLTELRPVVDVEERPFYVSKDTLRKNLRSFLTEFYRLTGIKPMIYTRATFWDPNVSPFDVGDHMLWVAHYTSVLPEPWVPIDWKKKGLKWFLWQWSADKNKMGPYFGASSRDIDRNRVYNGILGLKKEYPHINFTLESGPPAPVDPPKPEPPGEENMALVKIMHVTTDDGLNCRSNIKPSVKYGPVPGKTYPASKIYFTMPKGTKVEVIEEIMDGKNIWARIGQQQYAAIRYDDKVYLL